MIRMDPGLEYATMADSAPMQIATFFVVIIGLHRPAPACTGLNREARDSLGGTGHVVLRRLSHWLGYRNHGVAKQQSGFGRRGKATTPAKAV